MNTPRLASLLALGFSAFLPAQVFMWDGGSDGDWSSAGRWNPAGGPPNGAGDTAIIQAPGVAGPYIVTLDGSYSVDDFAIAGSDAVLNGTNRSFTVNGPSQIAGGAVYLDTSTYNANGAIAHTAGFFDLLDGSTLSGTGTYTKTGGNTTLNGATVSIPVTHAAGIFNVTGSAIFQADLDNQADITIKSGGSLLTHLGDLDNTGTYTIESGGSAYFRTRYFGSIYPFDNTGTIDVQPGGSLNFQTISGTPGSVIMRTGSSMGGGGAINFTGQTVDLQYSWNPGSSPLTVTSSTFNGSGDITISPGTPFQSTGSTFNVPVNLTGALTLSPGTSTFLDDFTGGAGGSVTMSATTTNTLRIDDNDFSNAGVFTMETGTGALKVQEVDNDSLGIFRNTDSGTVTVEGTGSRRFEVDVDNAGTFNLNKTTEWDNVNGIYTNSGDINAHTSQLLVENARSFTNSGNMTYTGGPSTAYDFLFFGDQNAASVMDNSGTITVENGLWFYFFENQVNSGTINVDGGNAFFRLSYFSNPNQFDNHGDIVVAPGAQAIFDTWNNGGSGAVTLHPGSSLGGGGNIRFTTQVVDVQLPWSPGDSDLVLSSTSLNGTGSLTIANGSILDVTSTTFNATTDNHGAATFNTGTNSTLGTFTNKSDGSVNLDATTTNNLRFDDNDLTNEGQFTMDAGPGALRVYEIDGASLGSFVNAPSGTVTVEGTGSRRFEANVDNQGSFDLNSTTEWDNNGGEHSNSGDINANTSQLLVQNARSFTNSGNMTYTGGPSTAYDFLFFGDQNAASVMDNSGTITVENGLWFYFFENQVNSGTINVDGGNAYFRLSYFSNPNQFDNHGDIVVAPGAQVIFDTWNNGGAGNVTLHPGSSLGGGGNIHFNTQVVDVRFPWSPGASSVFASGTTFTGAGAANLANGSTLTASNTAFSGTTDLHGAATFNPGTNSALGTFTIKTDGSVSLDATTTNNLRIDDNIFTNEGQFTMDAGPGALRVHEIDGASLGSFVNSPTGIVTVDGTGSRRFEANVDNQGLFTLNSTTEFDNGGGEHVNSGTINAPGNLQVETAFSFTNTGNLTSTGGNFNLAGNNAAGSLLDNSGTVTVENGWVSNRFRTSQNSGLFDINGGNAIFYTTYFSTVTPFTNSGDIDIAPGATATFSRYSSGTGSLILAPGSTLAGGGTITVSTTTTDVQGAWDIDDSDLNVSSASINGAGSLTVGPAGSLDASASNFGATVDNFGAASFTGSSTANGAFTNKPGGSFTLKESASLRINDNDFTNEGNFLFPTGTGTIRLYETDAGSTGVFHNTPAGTVTVDGTGSRRFEASVVNEGLFTLNSTTEFDNGGGEHVNSGTINAPGNLQVETAFSFTNTGTGNLTSTGGNFNLAGNNAAGSLLDNSGTVTVENGWVSNRFRTSQNSGLFDINGGNAIFYTTYFSTVTPFTNSGDIDVAPGATATFSRYSSGTGSLILAPGSTLAGGGTITVSTTTTDVQGAWDIDDSDLNVSSASINGAGSLTVGPAGSLDASASNFGATVDNFGAASFTGSSTANGAFTNKPGGSFTLEESASLRINDNDFTNEGNFLFPAGTGTIRLYETDAGSTGVFRNTPAGTVTVDGTGSRRFEANVVNEGLITLNATTEFDNSGGEHSNSGTINAPGQLLVENAFSFTNSGTGNLTSTGGNFNFTGNSAAGSILDNSGTVTVENGWVSSRFRTSQNSGLFDLNGGNAIFYTTYFSTVTPFTNSGVLDIAPGATATFSRFSSGTGVATNAAGGRITGGGTVAISVTNFTNHGTLAPGNSVGILTVAPMTHSATAAFEIEIGGTGGPGVGHDQLVVTGNLALNGTLKLSRLNNFVPNPADTFVIITATGELTGNFTSVIDSDPLGDWTVTVDETNDQVVVSFVADTEFDYTDFQNSYFTAQQIANGDADPGVDFDGDGVKNFEHWFYGTNPIDGKIGATGLEIRRTGASVDLLFPESNLLPPSAIAEIQSSIDVENDIWTTLPGTDYTRLSEVAHPTLPDSDLVTLRITNAVWTAEDERFFRLLLSDPGP